MSKGIRGTMDAQSAVTQTGRLLGGVYRLVRGSLTSEPGSEEPTVGELWEEASPDLEKALVVYDKLELPTTPESNWNPFADSKESCQKEINRILDTLLVLLGTCGAAGYRDRIRNLEADVVSAQGRIARYREQMLSAPSESSQGVVTALLSPSRESLTDQIADENDRITGKIQQIENLKVGFREHLQQIGIHVTPETADSFLLPVEDDVVSMAAVITNISRLTEQLQSLVDASRETESHTKRYYGIYVLLVFAIDRIQKHFIRQVDEDFLPRLDGFEKEALRNVADALALISRGEHREQLAGNVTAGRKTVEACRLLAGVLKSHKRSVLEENKKVQSMAAAAVNTYRTVRLSFDVVELVGYCQSAFHALGELRLPPLRTFQNIHLNEELQRLADRMVVKE